MTDEGGGLFYRFVVMDPLRQVSGLALDTVTYANATATAQTDDMGWGGALALQAARTLGRCGPVRLFAELSLLTAAADSDFTATGTQTYDQYDLSPNSWNDPDSNNVPDGTVYIAPNMTLANVTGVGNVLSRVHYEMDMSLYTLGCGVGAACEVRSFSVHAAAGPTLTLAALDTSRTAEAFWNTGERFYRDRVDDRDVAVRAGIFAEVGADYRFAGNWAVGVAGRYDCIPGHVETRVAEVDISGLSVQFRLSCAF